MRTHSEREQGRDGLVVAHDDLRMARVPLDGAHSVVAHAHVQDAVGPGRDALLFTACVEATSSALPAEGGVLEQTGERGERRTHDVS